MDKSVQIDLSHRLEEIEKRLEQISVDLSATIEDVRLTALSGFPDRDPDPHRIYHENAKKRAQFWAKLRDEVLFYVIKTASMAIVIWVGWALFDHFKSGLK